MLSSKHLIEQIYLFTLCTYLDDAVAEKVAYFILRLHYKRFTCMLQSSA